MNRFPDLDPYTVLNLPRGCSQIDIKAAYKKAALASHPDRAPPAEKEEATARFKVVGEAYELLSDPRKRREYDGATGGGAFGAGSFTGPPNEEYEDDASRKHFGTSPNGVPFTFMWESSADSARRAQAGRRSGRPFGADGFDPFELFNMMFSNEFGSAGNRANVPRSQDPFGMMGGSGGMGGMGSSMFGDNDPFFQNHRRMADTMGFGFGALPPQPPAAPFASTSQRSGPPMGMFTNGPFSTTGFRSSSNTTYGGFGGTSESTTTTVVNGRKQTVTRKVDERGNETVFTQTPEGNTVFVNGVQQASHPLLGSAGSANGVLPSATANGRTGNAGGTADDPIVIDSESEPPTPSSNGGFGTRF